MTKPFILASFLILIGLCCQSCRTDRVARIVGTALNPDGTPARAVLEIEPVDRQNPVTLAYISEYDGAFATERLPVGRYRVGVDLGLNPQPQEAYGRTYYPGTPNTSEAIEIEIARGMPEPRILFTLPNRRPLVTMRGTVVYEDGAPANGVDVLFSPVGGYSTAQLWSQLNGEFSHATYGGVPYRVQSRTTELSKLQYGARNGDFESEALIIQPKDLEKPMLLVLHKKTVQTTNEQ